MANITFQPLNESHFPRLLQWLESPHVKKWWDQDMRYTLDLVREKFGKHISDLPVSNKSNKKTYAYIICLDEKEIGYIQLYNARDYAAENGCNLASLTGHVCGIDLFIGDENCLGKGIGPGILNAFVEQIIVPHFDYCLIDPAKDNQQAIKAFEKAGFSKFSFSQTSNTLWMLKLTAIPAV